MSSSLRQFIRKPLTTPQNSVSRIGVGRPTTDHISNSTKSHLLPVTFSFHENVFFTWSV